MTPQEALGVLNRELESCKIYIEKFEKTFKGQKSNFRYDVEIYKIAISAVEKQIPTNVKNKTLGYDGEYADCPNCGKLICEYCNLKRCPECGQALDWSDTE